MTPSAAFVPLAVPTATRSPSRRRFSVSSSTSAFTPSLVAATPRRARGAVVPTSPSEACPRPGRARRSEAGSGAVRMVADDSPPATGGSSLASRLGVSSSTASSLYVAFLFFLWYLFNIVFNLMNKKILNVWSNPWILSTLQLGVGSVMVLLRWLLQPSSRPNLSPKLLRALFLPTCSHLVGHVSTCISFSYVAVSFSHIVKACEPAFGALGSAAVLGEVYSPSVYLTLLPIIFGVALSAVTQISFSWPGFLFAMLSNVAFASRNIFSKLTMGDFKNDPTLTPQNIYGIMSVMALLIEIPFALAFEGLPVIPTRELAYLLGGSGVFYTLYNTVSFMALGKTGVVTHAVGNILKRASVIVVSIMFFKNPIKPLNGVGMGIALLGTFLYSIVKQRFLAKKKADAAGKAA